MSAGLINQPPYSREISYAHARTTVDNSILTQRQLIILLIDVAAWLVRIINPIKLKNLDAPESGVAHGLGQVYLTVKIKKREEVDNGNIPGEKPTMGYTTHVKMIGAITCMTKSADDFAKK